MKTNNGHAHRGDETSTDLKDAYRQAGFCSDISAEMSQILGHDTNELIDNAYVQEYASDYNKLLNCDEKMMALIFPYESIKTNNSTQKAFINAIRSFHMAVTILLDKTPSFNLERGKNASSYIRATDFFSLKEHIDSTCFSNIKQTALATSTALSLPWVFYVNRKHNVSCRFK